MCFPQHPHPIPRIRVMPGTWQAPWKHVLNEWIKSLKYLLGFKTSHTQQNPKRPERLLLLSGLIPRYPPKAQLANPQQTAFSHYLHVWFLMSPPWTALPCPVSSSGLNIGITSSGSPPCSLSLSQAGLDTFLLCSTNKFYHSTHLLTYYTIYSYGHFYISAIRLSTLKWRI